MKTGTLAGAMPEKVSVRLRPIVTAGFANDVDDVKKQAAAIHARHRDGAETPATGAGERSDHQEQARRGGYLDSGDDRIEVRARDRPQNDQHSATPRRAVDRPY